ncbi:hypothetical protein ABIC71_001717 [Herbaspirillum seropedicae]|uniref:hypothetical protein n=1 Tax=Herbaspirillum seropedicae TaxID=964 RepID=UPI0033993270
MNTNQTPSPWQQIIDRLVGPPNETVLAARKGKPFWLRHRVFLVGMFTSLALLVAPEFVNQWNRVPDPATLQTLQVRILRTDLTEPHLLVELPDGQRQSMEWPVDIGLRGRFISHAWTDAQRESLPGCMATVQGAPLKLTLTKRFRIWSLDCPEKNISINFNTTSKSHAERLLPSLLIALCIFLPCGLLQTLVFLREKRGRL